MIHKSILPALATVSGALLQSAAASLTGRLYQKLFADPSSAPRGGATSPAGTFHGCFVYDAQRDVLGKKISMKTYGHPAVPISGFVRSEGTTNGKKITIELTESGITGAKSSS